MVKNQTESPQRLHKGGDTVTIIEYNANNPHPAGFKGLRVFVRKIDAPPFQEYISFSGLNPSQVRDAKIYAQKIDEYHTEDQRQRRFAQLINSPSRSPLSCVLGINVCLISRHDKHGGFRHEFAISVTGAGMESTLFPVSQAGDILKLTRALTRYDYPWFVQAWNKACRVRARAIGLKRTPSQWLRGIASEKDVARFIEKRIRDNLKKNKQRKRHAG